MNLKRIYKKGQLIIKRCTRCGEYKTIDNYNKGNRADGYQSYCILCMKDYRRGK